MLHNESKLQEIVRVFVGSVEWMLCHEMLFERGMGLVARVDGELRGVCVSQERAGQVFYTHQRIHSREGYSYYTVKPMERKDMFATVAWEEVRTGRPLFTEAEKAEWEEMGRVASEKEKELAHRAVEDERKREQAELNRLQEKYKERHG